MTDNNEDLWFINKGGIGIYTKKSNLAFRSMQKGHKIKRIKKKPHIFYFHVSA
ncbi:MAG: hypothetical protein R6U21_00925 [Thermoplasmatota archaeon]